MIPMAGTILAEWGADVIKIEHPERPDPLRTNVMGGRDPAEGGVHYMWEMHNRGKRGITLDLVKPEAREVLTRLVAGADVFLTNMRASARPRVGVDTESIQSIKPEIIYASATGMGTQGPEAARGGYDTAAFWARSGIAFKGTAPGVEAPPDLPSAGFGDIITGSLLAGAIAAALAGRSNRGGRTGAVLETSLLAAGAWVMRNEIAACELFGIDRFFGLGRASITNPLNAAYRTSDDRFVQLVMLEADLHWPDLCKHLDRQDLIDHPQFATMQLRAENSAACVATLEAEFMKRDLAEWREILATATGVWGVVQNPHELSQDPQVLANGYMAPALAATGNTFPMVVNPVKFDGATVDPGPAPDWGQHSEEVLSELGIDAEQLLTLRISGAVQ
jgi:crotonobetainyl-CoA:carnitine CoA-transferase CaiB-like acyl-CoA transferase